jgi:MscS family membrane protein
VKKTFYSVFFLLFVALTASVCPAQVGLLRGLQTSGGPAAKQDPLGRSTPRGTLLGFIEAAQQGDTTRALNYLEITGQAREAGADREKLVHDLLKLFDRAYIGRINEVSDAAEPTPNSALLPNHERGGIFVAGNKQVDLLLVRVAEPNVGQVWLISWTTLSKVPDLVEDVEARDFERKLPRLLTNYQILSIPLWVWAWMLILIPPAALAGMILALFLASPFLLIRKFGRRDPMGVWKAVRAPLMLLLASFVHAYGVGLAKVPLLMRLYYLPLLRTIFIFSLAWIVWSLTTLWVKHMQRVVTARGDRSVLALVALGHRLVKAAIIIVALFSVLAAAGVNLTTALAGLGIGGIAVAFAAQKSLENLFGGVSVLSDNVIRVGDSCRFGEKTGTVEDIGLRSTRIRTPERVEISIPNGVVSTVSIENFSLRDKILINHKFGLRYETTADQLRLLVTELRKMLRQHPRVETDTARVRFTAFAESSLTVELFAYALTTENTEFLAIQEDVLLRTVEIVESVGTGFAFPSRTVYINRDSGGTGDLSALQEVEAWSANTEEPKAPPRSSDERKK